MEEKKEEVLAAVKNSLADVPDMVEEIGAILMDCANQLRVEQTESVFTTLSEKMDNFGNLIDFITELRNGLEYLDISTDFLSSWNNSLEITKEMLSAFENKDWITVADLIQYELHPLLAEGQKGLEEIRKRVAKP